MLQQEITLIKESTAPVLNEELPVVENKLKQSNSSNHFHDDDEMVSCLIELLKVSMFFFSEFQMYYEYFSIQTLLVQMNQFEKLVSLHWCLWKISYHLTTIAVIN